MSEPADEIMGSVTDQIESVMVKAGEAAALDLQGMLSIPVQKVGKRIVRSKPGESPRSETGRLLRTVADEVTRPARDQIALVISTSTAYDQFLVSGTSRMAPRPFDKILEKKWAPIIEDRLRSKLST
jgi:hypothetical protein